ncbi:NAD(P)-binding protein [Trematosphaeria pertusa]|uniref:NAD(P)-binding protein n=1 Tax=Trematosphaeria pertusa TaxID=390896 RepID=A0A6A6IRT8_9PLEO|nr:NAD(P)-binding protein [Trematosphaeria pertusa]KAF2252857.1 NAD(P)-binding protein [Trematosphaeria pertusa]
MGSADVDPDLYTKMQNLTSTYHRDVYPAVSPTNPSNSAAGKVVLITGASRGIGKAIAPSWAAAGASGIALCSRKAEDLTSTIEDIKAANPKTETLAVSCDVTQDAQVASLFAQIQQKFGKLDVVIANAGVGNQGSAFPKIGEMDPHAWWNDMQVNVRGVHLTAHHYIRTFGPSPSGTFINMTSSAATIVIPGISSYNMSKDACIRLVEFLDVEYPELRAFSLNPGIVKGIAKMEAYQPFALDTVELTGAFTVWLSSGRADKIRGGYVSVNWDVEELERHGEEIREKGLLKSKFLAGVLGPQGYAFGK